VNINLLLTFSRYGNLFFDSNEVRVSKDVSLSEELFKEFKVKEITQQLNFFYNEKSLKILLTNNISKANENQSYLHRYDLIVLYNDLCVLRENDRVPRSSDSKEFVEDTLLSFNNGIWLDDLEYLTSHFYRISKNKNETEKNVKLKLKADKFDLDPLD
jgi:hypothetical protein